MKTLLKILRFLYLLIVFTILVFLAPINYLTSKLLKYELMFLFDLNDKILTKINNYENSN
jgi:hypothetical protein